MSTAAPSAGQVLPYGLDVLISPGGVGLSGGQRQRARIAGALLVDSFLVLVDEATVGVDAQAEAVIAHALQLAEGTMR